MDPRKRGGGVAGLPRDEDHEIAADAAAMGESGIRRVAGTGGPGMAGAPTGDRVGGRTAHTATTGETTTAGMGRVTGAPGVAGARATNRGGSAAGGGGGSNG